MELKEEFRHYLDNQAKFVTSYAGKYIVLKNKEVLGVYDSEIEAYQETQKTHELGTFLIQFVESGTESYTQTFYSQVAI